MHRDGRELKRVRAYIDNRVRGIGNCVGWNECFNMNTLTEAKEHLLELIINEYVNLRGFAFAARWMEKYKYNNKRNVVKSKGLRNKLQHEE